MNKQAFNLILAEHRDRIFSQALVVLRHQQDAEDVTQEAFIRLWAHGLGLPAQAIRPWLLRVTHNLCIDRIRRRGAMVRNLGHQADPEAVDRLVDSETGFPSPDSGIQAEGRSQEILDALGTLGDETRSVMMMHYFQGMKLKDIAQTLGKNLNSVKVQVHRARKSLRLVLDRNQGPLARRQEIG